MKAIRIHEFGAPEVMQLEEIPDPLVGAEQVLIRVKAAGVNPLDTYLRAGVKIGDYSPTLPWIPGNDAAGIVEQVGTSVTKVKVSDRVYSQPIAGSYAELVISHESQVYPLHPSLSFTQGTCINIACRTAYYSLFTLAKATARDVVLVHGASGSVGGAAVQLALEAGLTVIGTAGSVEGMELIKRLGAQQVFNHRDPDYLKQIQDTFKGIDIVLEMAASSNLTKDISLMNPAGRIIVIGGGKSVEVDPVAIIGLGISIIGVRLSLLESQENEAIHASLYRSVENGALRPIVDREFPLAEAAKAHHAVEKSGSLGKICLIP
ncbi:Zn-dependent oxidoreductase, NADPH:quinone reductase [Synechococcus sp. PCC 7502]|uniref:NADPH:quinone reductase n=1 Tax=Synechococcus sp. PCC 7502 TaxID=1173263 RepID=UPI00029FB629|nr:NADPH:quinone reductase [Synechococcus sp. PCC 7502]AFY75058.1 Zn-dependent oxidoreductase, NADPH:quinone reductase [Synechococcus sp. PCC 7502]